MAQTRAQVATKRGRNLEKDRDAPTPKRQRLATHQKASADTPVRGKGRKRAIEDTQCRSPEPKRRQISERSLEDTVAEADNRHLDYPVRIWIREGVWPREYADADMEQALARKRSSSSLRRKRSDSGTSVTPSDQRPREEKSAQYRDQRYETLLSTKGSFMVKSKLDVVSESKALCRSLLEANQIFPDNSLFRDDLFDSTCQKIHDRNEARVIQDISRLIVPSAESLATYGAEHLEMLTESVNEGWNNSIPLTSTRPQPDYSVGFRREAFTDDQLDKLSPFIGDFITGDLSFFMATYYMYFPFLACEVKCGAAALDVADRQNAHSMTLAARGVVELFRLAKRESEVHRKILSFSVSHDHRSVRIYGYYPVIDGKDTKYYRHPIRTFDFTEMDGKEKWTTYQFIKNVYDTWMPAHFKMICSAIDQLPSNIDFDVQALSESTGLSQSLGSQLALSEADSGSLLVDQDDRPTMASPNTSFSQPTPAKRRKSPVKRSQGSTR